MLLSFHRKSQSILMSKGHSIGMLGLSQQTENGSGNDSKSSSVKLSRRSSSSLLDALKLAD